MLTLDYSGFGAENKIKAQFYASLAAINLGKANDVITKYTQTSETGLAAVRLYAEYRIGNKADSLAALVKAAQGSTDGIVLYLTGLVLVAEGNLSDALQTVSRHEGSLECVSLMVQIYLLQNQVSQAVKLVADAKKWAQDNIIYNLSDSWVKLRVNGEDAQNAYYTYEEINPPSVKSLVGQAVCQLELGRVPEAQESLKEALQIDGSNPEALVNSITAAVLAGKDYSDYETKLEQVKKDHPGLVDLKEKSDLFDKVAQKYLSA